MCAGRSPILDRRLTVVARSIRLPNAISVQTGRVDFPDDRGLVDVLVHFRVRPNDHLGNGGEAWVYALDEARVLRVLHAGGTIDHVHRRQRLVDELARSRPSFDVPEVLDVGEVHGRVFVIERRLCGRSVLAELSIADGSRRTQLIEAHLEAAAALGDLHLEARGFYGDLISDDAITTPTWRTYLEAKAAASLSRSMAEFASIDPSRLADALPEAAEPAYVHLDAFTGNMLTDGKHITAVLDFGATSVIGDRRLDPIAAAVYLTAPDITPTVRPADSDVAQSWLRNAGLDHWLEPARRWLAAFWTFAIDDPHVLRWCRTVLSPKQ
jgi:aminoglycoside phosphotransferase (APT) family kinase protein